MENYYYTEEQAAQDQFNANRSTSKSTRSNEEALFDSIFEIKTFSSYNDAEEALSLFNNEYEYTITDTPTNNDLIEGMLYINDESKYYYLTYIREAFQARLQDLEDRINKLKPFYDDYNDLIELYENNLNKFNKYR